MDTKDPDIRSQNSAYRRGLVLGLTMAEIMVLILFTLLLALASTLAAKLNLIHSRDTRIAQLEVFEREFNDLFKNQDSKVQVLDIIQRLERQKTEIASLQAEVNRLKLFEASGEALQDIIREIKRGGDQDVTTKQIVDRLNQAVQLAKDNETMKGQITQLSSQIKATGRGNEFPSCWVTSDGKTESIFEVLLTSSAIRIKDHYVADKVDERSKLPLSLVPYDSDLALEDFQRDLRPVYQWSVDHSCRFYVIIFSSVANVPVQLVNAVNGYFYPDSRIQYRPAG